MKRLRIYVSGVVQGVGYRYFARRKAQEIGVKGYVMNLSDGRVLVVVEGEEQKIDKFISWLKEGPRFASVKSLDVVEEEFRGEFKSFEIRY